MSDQPPNEHDGVDEPPTPAQLHAMYRVLSDRVDDLAGELARNTGVTKQVQANTADLVDLFDNARGAFKVLEGLGKAAKPLMYIAGFVGSALTAWAAFKSHRGGS